MSETKSNMSYKEPIILTPSFRYSFWGGDRLCEMFPNSRKTSGTSLAEVWLCSTYPESESIADGGAYDGRSLREIIGIHPEMLGTKNDGLRDLPIMVKMIDAGKALSLQVHPDDDYAEAHEEDELGKTELWYVLDAEEGSAVTHGFLHDSSREEAERWILEGSLGKHLRIVPVKKGDVVLVDAGTVHGINAGPVIVEVQERSDITYRIWDYDRTDEFGNKRELHLSKALDVMNYKKGRDIRRPIRQLSFYPGGSTELLGRCRYFDLHRLAVNDSVIRHGSGESSFEILICIDGQAEIKWAGSGRPIKTGTCVFVPAGSVEFEIEGSAVFLKVES